MTEEERKRKRKANWDRWRAKHPSKIWTKTCAICSTVFTVPAQRYATKLCSQECRKKWKYLRHVAQVKKDPERRRIIKRNQERKTYDSLITAYGGKCVCCGESRRVFLNIDHVNGGGNEDRKKRGGISSWYRWVKNNGFPSDYRILCANCNLAFKRLGACPHQDESVGTEVYYRSDIKAKQAGGRSS